MNEKVLFQSSDGSLEVHTNTEQGELRFYIYTINPCATLDKSEVRAMMKSITGALNEDFFKRNKLSGSKTLPIEVGS